MNNHEYEHRPSFGDRLLERLSDSMNRTLQYLWHHRREDHDAEAALRLDGYGKAYEGPARRMLDVVEQRTLEGVRGWREPPLPGLEPSIGEDAIARGLGLMAREEQQRRDEYDRSQPRRSIWAGDMRDAENAALQVVAAENTHDLTHGRER